MTSCYHRCWSQTDIFFHCKNWEVDAVEKKLPIIKCQLNISGNGEVLFVHLVNDQRRSQVVFHGWGYSVHKREVTALPSSTCECDVWVLMTCSGARAVHSWYDLSKNKTNTREEHSRRSLLPILSPSTHLHHVNNLACIDVWDDFAVDEQDVVSCFLYPRRYAKF